MATRLIGLLGLALVASCREPTRPDTEADAAQVATSTAGSIGRTRLTIDGDRFRVNGQITYQGKAAAGALMNVRMVNAVFEDRNRPQFDPEGNTGEFLKWMPDYVSQGVGAFTISLQGGYPGYEGARNSAFRGDGDLDARYIARVAQVIERADELGAVIILSLFYQRQDQALEDEAAVRAGVINAVNWIRGRGYRNVILEIANEYGHRGFDHAVLRSDAGVAGLIRVAKDRHPSLPVSASSVRNGEATPRVAAASDLILTHFDGLSLSEISERMKDLVSDYNDKPVVANEDQRAGSAAAAAAERSVEAGGSYGLMLERKNQYYPFEFRGRSDDPIVYERYAQLTQ